MRKWQLVWMLAALAQAAPAQQAVTHEGNDGLRLSSGKAELVVLPRGGAFVSFVLSEDEKHVNPLWDPLRMAREAGLRPNFGASLGHFLCVDGFGPVTKAERAAGLPGHGEAHELPWNVVTSSENEVTFRVLLPKVREVLTRKISMVPGEQVALVESGIESLLPFDRVMLWAEHATIGAPFLSLGKTVVDQSASQCQTKPYTGAKGPRTFPSGENFTWPMVKTAGGEVNARVAPGKDGTMNHAGCLFDPRREHEFVTAISLTDHLLLGYLIRREDYPWIQHWMNYPSNRTYSWGLEFGMQPYDMTKEEILALSPMFGKPAFRWLPAKSKVSTKFLMFLTKVPEGFDKVDDVRLESGKLVIENHRSNRRITLAASRGLE
ncbi:MAG: hypothetical protein IANPNBLG_03291 [Bryobacteraceae bacterium]|nr:hypothetical protein [Bryobacteraceae bacterium]